MEQKTFPIALAGLLHDLAKADPRVSQLLPDQSHDDDQLLELASNLSVGIVSKPTIIPAPHQEWLCSIFSLVDLLENGQTIRTPKELFLPIRTLQAKPGDAPFLIDAKGKVDISHHWKELIVHLETLGFPADGNLEILIEKTLGILQQYGWCLPSTTHTDLKAIGLYDHSRITAALASCLASFDNPQIKDWQSGKDLDKQVGTLVGGDISGIQKFIYTITSKGSASALRGRSLYLQYLTDAVARFVLRRLQLPLTSLIFAGGGHFYLLARTDDGEKILEIQREVSKILLAAHGGDLYLALAEVPLEISSLSGKSLSTRWSQLSEKLRACKLRQFSELGDNLHDLVFMPYHDKGNLEKECAVCGREDEDTSGSKCRQCRDFEELGKDLRRARFLAISYVRETPIKGGSTSATILKILAAFGWRYTLYEGIPERREASSVLYALNDDDMESADGRKFLVNVTPLIHGDEEIKQLRAAIVKDPEGESEKEIQQGAVKSFSALEMQSKGDFKRLGILRMDVDNMGEIVSKGLGERANLSRIASLSFMINLFFEGIAAELARKYNKSADNRFDRVYSIYSGGDDLFFVGSWDVMPNLALDIRNRLIDFTGGHPGIHLSGGIALVSGKYPLYQAAEDASSALEASKRQTGKNSLTFLGQSMYWNTFAEHILPAKQSLADFVETRDITRQVLQRLVGFQLQYEKKKKDVLSRGEDVNKAGEQQIIWGPWNWRSAYYLKRIKPRSDAASAFVKKLAEKLEQENFGDIEWIGFAARWADLETRGE